MQDQDFEIPDDAPVDPAVIKEAKAGLKTLVGDLVESKQKEAKILQQSMAAGGPGSFGDALRHLFYYERKGTPKVGIRELSRRTGVKRKLLQKMIDGEVDMPTDVSTLIIEVFEQRYPDLF